MAKYNISSEKLYAFAANAARQSKVSGKAPSKQLAAQLGSAMAQIESSYLMISRKFAGKSKIPEACEWILDNKYLAVREGKNAKREILKAGSLLRCGKSYMLINLCSALVDSGEVSREERCRIFLDGYQSEFVIPSRELELFPSALKAVLIMRLADICRRLADSSSPEEFAGETAEIFASLRFSVSVNMNRLIEKVDICEALLASDPAGIYTRMDAETKSLYRRKLSDKAKKSGKTEHELASDIVEKCRKAQGSARHVGFYLFDERPGSGSKYIAANLLLTLFLTLLCAFLSGSAAVALLLVLPFSELIKSLLDYIILLTVPPAQLCRMEIKNCVPAEGKTICVISTLLGSGDRFDGICRKLEEFYLSNRSRGNLYFGILGDLPESDKKSCREDIGTLKSCKAAVDALNLKYGGGFYLFTRERSFDEGRGKFCGKERKRGAILALAALICGEKSELAVSCGNFSALKGCKYIISLDGDTHPAPDSLKALIGAMLHPMNRPVTDEKAGIVTSGHGIIHPRMSTELASVYKNDFTRIFAGSGGAEPYSVLCGELYMDLFDRGGFYGKGIIDAKALLICSKKHIPDGKVLSHDALEGAYLRGAYDSCTEFYDTFPSNLLSYFKRQHRWIRGDWQNSPRIFSRSAKLPDIERWRLFDSVRRSLVPPFTFAAIVLGLTIAYPGLRLAAVTALIALISRLLIALTDCCTASLDDIRLKTHSRVFKGLGAAFLQSAMRLWFLPCEAWVNLSAAVQALWRMLISGKNLLQWETSAQAESGASFNSKLSLYWPCLVSGLLLMIFAPVAGKVAGLFWIASPFAASALSKAGGRAPSLTDGQREYLSDCARSIWSYFDTFCTKADNYLPPDNYQEQPPVGLAHRSSPTNIGLALLSCMAAGELGIDGGRANEITEKMLSSIEALPKYKGQLFNWYDTRSLAPLEPAYVSTVDCGNFYACLLTLSRYLNECGNTELAARVERLMQSMDFSMLFDEDKGLFRIGISTDKNEPSPGHYDLLASESRLTSYIAIAKGDVPRSHWRKLSRAMLKKGAYQGLSSWTGTMFEYLMPELFLPLTENSLLYESTKYCLYVQKSRKFDGVWGISESAFFALDSSLSYCYKAHGCSHLALKRGQDRECVISPYSTFLALMTEPQEAFRNLKALQSLGACGKFGFIEAIDFTKSRCRSGHGEMVRCYMAHHLGMSMLALANVLCNNSVCRRFMSDARMHAYRSLLEEKLPTVSTVLKTSETALKDSVGADAKQWILRGDSMDFESPECCVLSNGVYNIMLTETGICTPSCSDMLIYSAPSDSIGGGHGLELSIRCGGKSISLLPEPNEQCSEMWEFSEKSASFCKEQEDFYSKVSAAVAGSVNGEVRDIELKFKKDASDCLLELNFEPVLAMYSDYVNHPAFWRLGLEASSDGGCLMLQRLARGSCPGMWLCLACSRLMSFSADRYGALGALTAPYVTATVQINAETGSAVSLRFALCIAESRADAFSGAQRMLAMGPGEYGCMPSLCAAYMGISSSEIGAAMGCISPLRFPRAQALPFTPKQGLWKYGISGDLPIVCCGSGSGDVAAIVKRFCLLRACGVYSDLVFICDESGDYFRPVYSRVRDTLADFGLETLLNSGGGIYVLPSSAADVIEHSASLIIGKTQRQRRVTRHYELPEGKNRKGAYVPDFDWDKENSFVFYVNHSLPSKCWSHMLTNGSFGYLACDTGFGGMWHGNAREMRISRWENNPYAINGPESLEYTGHSGSYSLFAANDGIPCRVKYGFGFASWEKSLGNCGIRTTAFIPPDINARVFIIAPCGCCEGSISWRLQLQLASSEDDSTAVDCDYVNSMFTAVNSRSYYDNLRFIASATTEPLAWTCDNFAALRGDFNGIGGTGVSPAFAAIYPAEATLVIACGTCDKITLQKLCKPKYALEMLQRTKQLWRSRLLRLRTDGCGKADRLLCGWAAYQATACRLMGRCSVYQSGGATGFRDQLQDAVNMILISPEMAKRQILSCCAHQYEEGDVMHWWHQSPEGDKGVRTRCSDDLLWLVWALCEYTEKTGDTGLCFCSSYYVNSSILSDGENDRYETPMKSTVQENVLSHAQRAVDLCLRRGRGSHGLLLFGSSDWNDGMDRVRGESVWLTWFFAHTVRRFSDLLFELCKPDAAEYRAVAGELARAADGAWDGAWYLRGYWPDGEKLGSRENECCRIDSISQSWAVMCPEADSAKASLAVESALEQLYDRDRKIIKLFTPPFYGEGRDPGYIRSYGPGFRENGGQYTHATIWLAMACIRLGRSDDAWDILNDLLPENHDMRVYLGEPFVIPADVSESGEAGWTWYTGSAGWYFRVFYEELLGLRLWAGKLYIRPSLPESFPAVNVTWTDSAGKEYNISIEDSAIFVNGEKYDGKGLPYTE